MAKLYFATGNKGKVEEAGQILKTPIEILDVDLDEIQESSVRKIVIHKVTQAYEKVKSPVFVDDVSLEVEAWNGFPGPFAKFIRKDGTSDLLLYMMRNETNRKVNVISTIGFHDGKKIHVFNGTVKGVLTREEKGKNGWGFDPIFIPDGQTLTFAEMKTEIKNKLSHRRRALDMLKKFLNSQK